MLVAAIRHISNVSATTVLELRSAESQYYPILTLALPQHVPTDNRRVGEQSGRLADRQEDILTDKASLWKNPSAVNWSFSQDYSVAIW